MTQDRTDPLEDVLAGLSDPPPAWRPAPFFVLNDEHEGLAGEPRLTELLEAFVRAGYGGAFLHARPGLITEYLSPRWFELIRHCIRECDRLGLVPYLYDENYYPSGFAGGHVAAAAPEARSRYVTPSFGTGPDTLPGGLLAVYRWDGTAPGERVEQGELAAVDRWIAFALESIRPMHGLGETAFPSLQHPHTTGAFIESTHEAYRRELGDLLAQTPAIFTDEPHLPSQNFGPWGSALPFSPYLLGEFERRYGYDLRDHLASVFFDIGEFRQVRYDLYDLGHDLWLRNWALPLERWCDEHGIALTGHYLEHDWPAPYATPGHVHLLAHMQWPGTDLLETFLLAGHEEADIQGFVAAPPSQEPHGLVFLRQVHSVVNQLGKARNLNETWGAGGHDSTPADWLRIGRWLAVHGVNLFNPHHSFTTVRGTRKTDHPQFFSEQSPWFDDLEPVNTELGRLAWACSRGEIANRVLVLDPLTTGYCLSRKADALPPGSIEGEAHDPAMPGFQRVLASIQDLRRSFSLLAQELSDRQVDFDTGDEYVVTEFGSTEHESLVVGQQQYEAVIWPMGMTNLRSETADLLETYLASGGTLLGVRPETFTIDGRASDRLAGWETAHGNLCWYPDQETLADATVTLVPPRVRVSSPPPTGLAHMRRACDWGEVVVLVNSSASAVESDVAIESRRSRVTAFDPASGSMEVLPAKRNGDHLRTRIAIGPCRALMLLATDEEKPFRTGGPAEPPGEVVVRPSNGQIPGRTTLLSAQGSARTDGRLQPVAIETVGPNVLVIDTCEVRCDTLATPRLAVYAANAQLWQWHGFESNGWQDVVQFRRQIVDRAFLVGPDSGIVARYRFDITGDVDTTGFRLAVETPELWHIAVNGQTLAFAPGETWLDVRIGVAAVGSMLVAGNNEITLAAPVFDPRVELDQIYLLGDFACVPAEVGFAMVPPQPLALGSWREQGYPFLDRGVRYVFKLPEGGPGVLRWEAGDWNGSLLRIEQGGALVARLMEAPWDIALDPADGREVTVTVVGLAKNLLGPFHAPGKQRKRAGPGMWWGPSIPETPQPGAAYDLLDFGVLAPPIWLASDQERARTNQS